MNTPNFYHDSIFTLAETAEIAGRGETELRTRLARGETPFSGYRKGGRLYFSAHEAYALAMLGAMTDAGISPATASWSSWSFAGKERGEIPDADARIIVTWLDGAELSVHVATVADLAAVDKPSLVLPLEAIWNDVVGRAYRVHATEES